MSTRRSIARFSFACALVGTFALTGAVAPAAGAGEPDGVYSAGLDDGGFFIQLDKDSAAATALPDGPREEFEFHSVEVVNGVGYAIGVAYGDDEFMAIFTWDIVTGEVLTVAPVSLDGDRTWVGALDTLPDGTLLVYTGFEEQEWLASIDPVTGVITLLVNLDELDADRLFEGIATNPVDGVTYLLTDYADGMPGYSPIDIATGTLGDVVPLPEIRESLGDGFIAEGDFAADGTLWFTYGEGVARTEGPVEVGVEAIELGTPDIQQRAITVGQTADSPVDPRPAPQLAATGLELAPIAGGAAILFALGGALLIARRRVQAP